LNDEIVEIRNVFDDLAYCGIKGTLQAELDAWWRQQAARYPDKVLSYAKA
jgi:hypothetical protein